MNEQELEKFSQELQRIRPAAPPRDFVARLTAELEQSCPSAANRAGMERKARTGLVSGLLNKCVSALALREGLRNRTPRVRRQSTVALTLFQHYRWLSKALAATACLGLAAVVTWRTHDSPNSGLTATAAPLKADDVQIDHELVSSFDTIARLPSGEPVRFRCQKWVDQTVISDKARGLTIERRTPRVEVVPVRFETY